eukprot:CAMPEP_0184855044 /NCGR_PEP_ID=MMETSP0580-20130426/381_1 /TAXON_ID=1118495 /ORGANISM="Dactyliosolen fragilissimus" /LENGTH=509 /DNA_ID=CAMNT_0027349459 /DNA_START=277 /DNA_END=1806 /DNA_ORIENTATION=+
MFLTNDHYSSTQMPSIFIFALICTILYVLDILPTTTAFHISKMNMFSSAVTLNSNRIPCSGTFTLHTSILHPASHRISSRRSTSFIQTDYLLYTTTNTNHNRVPEQKYSNLPFDLQSNFNDDITLLCKGSSRHIMSISMGKGDGKKKRKKKSVSSTSSTNTNLSSPAQPGPLRVTSNSLVPVRRQIKYAQMKKKLERSSQTSFRQTNLKRTSYRKSLDEEKIEEARLERQRLNREPDWDVILNATVASPLVIVDAYNIIHKWPRLKKWMRKGMLSKARETLIRDLEDLRVLKGWRIEAVFDGYGRESSSSGGSLGDAPGNIASRARVHSSERNNNAEVSSHGVRVIYSGIGASADAYIEGRCLDAKRRVTAGKLSGSFIVASDDSVIRCAAVNAGAVCMGADHFVDQLKAVRMGTLHRVEAAVARANGRDMAPMGYKGTTIPDRIFRNGSVIVEDKRKKNSKKQQVKNQVTKEQNENNENLTKRPMSLGDLKKGTTSIPSWAIVPQLKK